MVLNRGGWEHTGENELSQDIRAALLAQRHTLEQRRAHLDDAIWLWQHTENPYIRGALSGRLHDDARRCTAECELQAERVEEYNNDVGEFGDRIED